MSNLQNSKTSVSINHQSRNRYISNPYRTFVARIFRAGLFCLGLLTFSSFAPHHSHAQDKPSGQSPQGRSLSDIQSAAEQAKERAEAASERLKEIRDSLQRGGDDNNQGDNNSKGDRSNDQSNPDTDQPQRGDRNQQGDKNPPAEKAPGFSILIRDAIKKGRTLSLDQQIESVIDEGGTQKGKLYPTAKTVRMRIDWAGARQLANTQRAALRSAGLTNVPTRPRLKSGKRREYNKVTLPILAPLSGAGISAYFNGDRDYYLSTQEDENGIWTFQGSRRATIMDGVNPPITDQINIFNTEEGMAAQFSLFGAAYGVQFSCTLPAYDNVCYDHNRMRRKIDELLIYFGNSAGR